MDELKSWYVSTKRDALFEKLEVGTPNVRDYAYLLRMLYLSYWDQNTNALFLEMGLVFSFGSVSTIEIEGNPVEVIL